MQAMCAADESQIRKTFATKLNSIKEEIRMMRKRNVIPIQLFLILVLAASMLSAQSASTWVFLGPDGLLHYKTDSQGNRIMDFSFAGYKGGGIALPVVPASVRESWQVSSLRVPESSSPVVRAL